MTLLLHMLCFFSDLLAEGLYFASTCGWITGHDISQVCEAVVTSIQFTEGDDDAHNVIQLMTHIVDTFKKTQPTNSEGQRQFVQFCAQHLTTDLAKLMYRMDSTVSHVWKPVMPCFILQIQSNNDANAKYDDLQL